MTSFVIGSCGRGHRERNTRVYKASLLSRRLQIQNMKTCQNGVLLRDESWRKEGRETGWHVAVACSAVAF